MNALMLAALVFGSSPSEATVDAAPAPVDVPAALILVVGAEGSPEFGEAFREAAGRWQEAADDAEVETITIGLDEPSGAEDRELLRERLSATPTSSPNAVWLVLIGHGTFDGERAKFNLRGPDVESTELAEWLEPFERPVAIINCASSSGPFINHLSHPGRVVVTATRSGAEQNYTRFATHMARAIADSGADLDKDDQTSLLEAYLAASHGVEEFYQQENRLATEHALLDDNGDRAGTPPDWFEGVRAIKKAKDGATADGLRAHQFHLVPSDRERNMPAAVRARRDEIELTLAMLRDTKATTDPDAYYAKLEPLLIELARLYETLELPEATKPPESPEPPGAPALPEPSQAISSP